MHNEEEKLISTHIIIHASATASAVWASSASAVPILGPMLAGVPVLAAINVGMVVGIGSVFGQSFESGVVVGLVGQILGMTFGTSVLKAALSIIPGIGMISNAAITFGVTEGVGWAAYLIFKDGRAISELSNDELQRYMERGKAYASEVKGKFAWLNELPPHIKAQYDHLTQKLAGTDLTDAERQAVLQQIEVLLEPFKPEKAE